MTFVDWKPRLIQGYRLAILLGILWLARAQHEWMKAQRGAPEIGLAEVRAFFPAADKLGTVDPATGGQMILSAGGDRIGYVVQTSPASDKIVGYSGPTNVLLAFDRANVCVGARILKSADTPDHVAMVVRDPGFWERYLGGRWKDTAAEAETGWDGVSGATLTSLAIREGTMLRLLGERPNLRFPEKIEMDEVKSIFPEAARLEAYRPWPESFRVHSADGRELGLVLRTGQFAGEIRGYRGPIDVLVALDAPMETIVAVRIRSSYDTPEYVQDVKHDDLFFAKFEGAAVRDFFENDLQAMGIEGVSGATMTSLALAGSVQMALKSLGSVEGDGRGSTGQLAVVFPRTTRDAMMLVVILLALLMAFTPLRKSRALRRLYQVGLIAYVGFISGDMLAQALLMGWAQNGVAWSTAQGLVLLVAASFFIPIATGRQVYCHHICPHGAAQQLLMRIRWRGMRMFVPRHAGRWLDKLPALLLLWVLVVGMAGLGFDLAGIEPFDAYIVRAAGWATIAVAVIGLVASCFVPMAYCRYGCPTGALLEFVRFRRGGEHFGRREVAAAVFFLVALGIYLGREVLWR